MGVDDGIKYNITMSEHTELSYLDGFSEGYARAWQECWDYWIDRIAAEKKAYEDLLASEAKDKEIIGGKND